MPFGRAGSTPVSGIFPQLLPKIMPELQDKLIGLGIAEEQIDSIPETVLGFIKEKLPEGTEGIVDSLIAGETPDLGDIVGSGLLDKAKGLFEG